MLIRNTYALENIKINLGIEILRTILCFWVLSFHTLDINKINYFLFHITKKKLYHVPCFSFISFYFSYKIFSEKNIAKLKKRLIRLLFDLLFDLEPYFNLIIFLFHSFFVLESLSSLKKGDSIHK